MSDVLSFLTEPTPESWLEQAQDHLHELVIDHANCEKKAAGAALSLIYRYVDRPDLIVRLSRLAREELRHFEQVCALMPSLGITYRHLSPARYAGALRRRVRTHEPARLLDTLVVCAIVEARSCERFYRLREVCPGVLGDFYARLLESEARHFKVYLRLAEAVAAGADGQETVSDICQPILAVESELITSPAAEFRFHSGPLVDKRCTD